MRLPMFWISWRGVLLTGIGLMLLLPLLNIYVTFATEERRYTDISRVPGERVAIVFGAGVRGDGRPTRMLADRIDAAVALYTAGQVQKLLMTGDNSSADYNEVAAMRRYAIERGVSPGDITLDYAGFSTYESCYRAHAIFGVERAVLVTQRFHLPRAVYTCQQLGVDAVGFGTSDWGSYHPALMLRYTIRETLATTKALLDVHITRPLPTFLGPHEPIS